MLKEGRHSVRLEGELDVVPLPVGQQQGVYGGPKLGEGRT